MLTNLQARFRAVRDVRTVTDPWGLGWSVDIRRDGCAALAKLRDELMLRNPMVVGAMEAVVRGAFVSEVTKDKTKGQEALERAVLDFKPDAAAILAVNGDDERFDAARAAGWRGLTDEKGEPVPYSPEMALELLRSEEWVDEGLPYGKQPLGRAIRQWWVEESRAAELYRAEVVAEAAGN